MNVLSRWSVLGAFVAGLALVVGLMPAGAAVAQDDDGLDDSLERLASQATDAGQRSFVYDGTDPTMPTALALTVIEFGTEEDAIAATDTVTSLFELGIGEMMGGTMATPPADLGEMVPGDATATPVAEFAAAEEFDVVDGGVAYHVSVSDPDLGDANLEYIVIRDGRDLHVWAGIGEAMEPGVEPADPHDLMNALVEDWFGAGSRAGDPILDRLPSADDLPDGYMLQDEIQGLDNMGAAGGDSMDDQPANDDAADREDDDEHDDE